MLKTSPRQSLDGVRPRHVSTAEREANRAETCLTDDLDSPDSLFELHPQYASSGPVLFERFFRIRHTASGYWLHLSPSPRDGADVDAEDQMAMPTLSATSTAQDVVDAAPVRS